LARTKTNLSQQHAKPFDQRDNTQIKTLTQQLETLKNEQKAFTTRIQKECPKYYALKYPQPVKLATLQNQVLQKGEILLVYGVLEGDEDIESKTILWIIDKNQFQIRNEN
jgi:hypothetical protein